MGEARLFPGVRHIGISIFLDFSLEGLKHFSVTPPSPSATLYVQIPFPRIGALLPALIFLIRQFGDEDGRLLVHEDEMIGVGADGFGAAQD